MLDRSAPAAAGSDPLGLAMWESSPPVAAAADSAGVRRRPSRRRERSRRTLADQPGISRAAEPPPPDPPTPFGRHTGAGAAAGPRAGGSSCGRGDGPPRGSCALAAGLAAPEEWAAAAEAAMARGAPVEVGESCKGDDAGEEGAARLLFLPDARRLAATGGSILGAWGSASGSGAGASSSGGSVGVGTGAGETRAAAVVGRAEVEAWAAAAVSCKVDAGAAGARRALAAPASRCTAVVRGGAAVAATTAAVSC